MPQFNKEADLVFRLIEEYQSFEDVKGIRRSKAVEWADMNLKKIHHELEMEESSEALLLRVGWITFMGLGLYCGVLNILLSSSENNTQPVENLKITLFKIVKDILNFTKIAYFNSLDTKIYKVDNLKFARVDDSGNIYIFPADVDDLLVEIEEKIYEQF